MRVCERHGTYPDWIVPGAMAQPENMTVDGRARLRELARQVYEGEARIVGLDIGRPPIEGKKKEGESSVGSSSSGLVAGGDDNAPA